MNFLKNLWIGFLIYSAALNAESYESPSNNILISYNAPAAIKVKDGAGIYISGSFIYWIPLESSMELGQYYPINVTTDACESIILPFDFCPGFKVALGYNSNFDGWNIMLEYLHFHPNFTKNFPPPSWAQYIDDYYTPTEGDSHLKADFQIKIDLLNLFVGRNFYNGKNLILQPVIGIKGGWIDQYLNVTATEINTNYIFTSKYGIKTWAIGPKMGMASKWLLGNGFRIEGDSYFNILYQQFDNSMDMAGYDRGCLWISKMQPRKITPNFDLNVGLGWGHYLGRERWNLDLSIFYEFQYYFRQNYFRQIYWSMRFGKIGDLFLNGLTVKVQFDF